MLTMTMTRLQMNLQFLNYYWGSIDGIKGSQTEQAIKDFQSDNGLPVNGIADQTTIDVLRELIVNIQNKVGADIDGVAGSETIEKTKIWQSNNGLVADGICGQLTRQAMFGNTPSEWNFPHFQQSEFACHCGCGFDNISHTLVGILEQIRSHFGDRPVIVTSGCRCAKHNAEVGGVQGSRHVLGKALDIYIDGVHVYDLLDYCQELVNNGTLRYTYTNDSNMNGVVHVDIQ